MNVMKKMPQEFRENPLRRGLKSNSLSFRRLFLFRRLKSLVSLLFMDDLEDDDGWLIYFLLVGGLKSTMTEKPSQLL